MVLLKGGGRNIPRHTYKLLDDMKVLGFRKFFKTWEGRGASRGSVISETSDMSVKYSWRTADFKLENGTHKEY